MTGVIPDAHDLFASAVPYYAQYRSDFPSSLIDTLASRLNLTRRDLVLDIGCATGQSAIPLARRVGRVIAIDPQPDMLAHGHAAARRAGITNIEWLRGDSTGLETLDVAGARFAVFAASFHWTDRAEVARVLDRLLPADGALVVISDGLPEHEEPEWQRAIAEIRARHLGPNRRTVRGPYETPQATHAEVLTASPFCELESLAWSWSRELTLDQVVGLQFSYSFSTPALFGDEDRAEAFAADVREAVAGFAGPTGTLVEPLRVDVLIARRPRRSSRDA